MGRDDAQRDREHGRYFIPDKFGVRIFKSGLCSNAPTNSRELCRKPRSPCLSLSLLLRWSCDPPQVSRFANSFFCGVLRECFFGDTPCCFTGLHPRSWMCPRHTVYAGNHSAAAVLVGHNLRTSHLPPRPRVNQYRCYTGARRTGGASSAQVAPPLGQESRTAAVAYADPALRCRRVERRPVRCQRKSTTTCRARRCEEHRQHGLFHLKIIDCMTSGQ